MEAAGMTPDEREAWQRRVNEKWGFFPTELPFTCPVDDESFNLNDPDQREKHWLEFSFEQQRNFLFKVSRLMAENSPLAEWHAEQKAVWEVWRTNRLNYSNLLPRAVAIAEGVEKELPAEVVQVIMAMLLEGNFPVTGYKVVVSESSSRLGIDVDVMPIDVALNDSAQDWNTTAERNAQYRQILAETALSFLVMYFALATDEGVSTILVNLNYEQLNAATGQDERICVTSVQVGRETFSQINLSRVDPVACLKALHAVVPGGNGDVTGIRPLADVRSFDPRFVDADDILTGLDSRPNLMLLTPSEFESLIQNLFQAMGLDTHQTQASRDGGVDAVAFDDRPVLGGKVIIQAKRYKNTVGVSAVRDLYGALLNEGASKGILVTTSGYGPASFDFARNKPLELLDGPNLLFLLKEHAGINATIDVPATWIEPLHDLA